MTPRSRSTHAANTAPAAGPQRVILVAVLDDGMLLVQCGGARWQCEWLETGQMSRPLAPGDRLLALPPDGDAVGVVLGLVGPYVAPAPAADVQLQAAETLTLRCGDASLTLKSNGQVLLKGEDVTVRAKGTQRIRAGNVAIN